MTAAAMEFSRDPANYEEASMQHTMAFTDSLKDLKNLRKQLYSAAEYFELSYSNDDQKDVVVNTLKDYTIKALVNTVDHLGSVSYKVNDLLDEKVDEVSGTELRVSCIEQRMRTCNEYIDREGLSQQSLVINTPKYHKRYIFPAEETVNSAIRAKSEYRVCSVNEGDDWHQFKDAIRATIRETPPAPVLGKGRSPSPSRKITQQSYSFSSKVSSNKDLEKRSISPRRFPLLRSGSFSSKPTTPKGSNPGTPNRTRPTTPNPSLSRQPYISEPRKSASMRIRFEREGPRESSDHQYPSKSKRLLKALLTRRKSKKDDMLYTYLDEY